MKKAVRDLRRTVFSYQCRPKAGSLKRRFYCLILTGQREPRDGHREMKFAVIRLACVLGRQQTLCRAIAVASRIVHGTLHRAPMCFGAESHFRWWLDSGRMRSLTGGVCIKLLTKLRHNQSSPLPVVPENSIRRDSRGEAESAHHPMRCLRSSTCLRRL
jgi:hypothetical protein